MKDNKNSFHKFLIIWFGELISSIGSGLSSFGLGVYVYTQTGLASATAIVTLFGFLPSLLLNPITGVLADRYDRRLLMIIGDSLSAIGLIYILLCILNGSGSLFQICAGITVCSIFSSLLDPAYKATITDLLTKDEYVKASSLVQIAGSSKFLISPIIAGPLFSLFNIKILLVIDIITFFVAALTTFAVRKTLSVRKHTEISSFTSEFKNGWKAISNNIGILILVIAMSLISFLVAVIETLSTPMILSFTSASILGPCETICACGMLVSSVVIGFMPIKNSYGKILSTSLCFSGIFMALFGARENIILICIAGFLFFATLPFANASIDVLIRSNIDNKLQGRAWGLISLISQFGSVLAYASVGFLADYIFTPLLSDNGLLAGTVGRIIGTGAGRGTGFLIIIAGIILALSACFICKFQSIRKLEASNVSTNYK